jgi:cytochrome c biogenesis protein CcmG/thiol:disulfide interchange protein DsbE
MGSQVRRSDRTFRIIAVLACAGLVAFIAAVIVTGSPSTKQKAFPDPPPPAIGTGKPGPGFALGRLGGGADVELTSFRGRPVVLNFFASWCPDCQAELSTVATFAREESGRIDVVGIDTNESDVAASKKLLLRADAKYPVALDPLAKVATRYLIQALPVTYFLDSQGRVMGEVFGQVTSAELSTWAKRLGAGS